MKNAVTVTLIGKTTLALTEQLVSLYVEKRINALPFAEISLATGSFSERDYPLFDKFNVGDKLEIKIRYEDSNEQDISVFKGVIYQRTAQVKRQQPMLTLLLNDPARQLCQSMATRIYHEKNDEDIIKSILTHYQGLSLSGQSPAALSAFVMDQSVQYQQSDWQQILERIQANGLVLTLNNGEITLLDITQSPKQSLTLTMGIDTSVLDFEFSENARQLCQSVNIRYWDQDQHKPDSVEKQLRHPLAKKLNGPDAHYLVPHIGHKKQAANFVRYFEARQILSAFKGTIQLTGKADIAPGQGITLERFPLSAPDNLMISGVTHAIQNGKWTTTLQVGAFPAPLLQAKEQQLPAQQACGLLWGRVQKWQADPKKRGRIALQVPALGKETYWAYLGQFNAGKKQGSYFLPGEGDLALVAFVHDNPALGVLLTSIYDHNMDLPAPFKLAEDSPTGIQWQNLSVIFNPKEKCIEIKTADKNTLQLSQDKGLSMNTKTQLKIESGSGAELKAGAAMNIKGQVINLN